MGACLSTEKVVGGHAAEHPPPKSEVSVAEPSSPKPAASMQVDVTEIDANDLKDMIKISEHAAYTLYTANWHGSAVSYRLLKQQITRENLHKQLMQAASARHPSLMLFMGFVFSPKEKRFGLVSPFMKRGSLFDVLHKPVTEVLLPWRYRINAALDVARALLFIHRSGHVHSNLTSQTILVDEEYRAKLSDFGLSSLLSSDIAVSLPLWTAPEVIMGAQPTPASDVYSFAIVLWELLTRHVPFDDDVQTPIRLLRMITNSNLRPTLPEGCPPQLIRLIESCWNADASQRPNFETIVDELGVLSKFNFDVSHIMVAASMPKAANIPFDVVSVQRAKWHIPFADLKLGPIIGAGSFGQVHQGSWHGKTVAIKVLWPELAQSTQVLSDFSREIALMSTMRHPNTVLFLGACIQPPNLCIVTEFCSKGSLHSVLHDKGSHLDYDHILNISEGIAQGMAFLHGSRPPMLHRDLKSLNVLLDESWCAKIADFGLTSAKTESSRNQSTMLGTPLWQAPEALEGANLDEAADVYSFAVIIWELWTRQNPFSGVSPVQAAMSVLTKDARPAIPDFVPPAWTELIQMCWQRNKQNRPLFPQIIARLQAIRQEGLPKLTLGKINAQHYRKNALVHAIRSRDPVTVFKSWGSGESKPGDWIIVGKGDDVYTCDHVIFLKTYRPEPGAPHMYRKIGTIWAKKMPTSFLVLTLEGMEHGQAGDYLAQNAVDGEQWPIDAATFEKTYEVCPI